MIIKSLTRKSQSGQLINYIFRYILKEEKISTKPPIDRLNDKKDKPLIIRHNVRSQNVQGYIREFKEVEQTRIHTRSNQTSIHHTIISWSNKDRELVNDKMLKDIAEQYISLRGENNLFVGTKHSDRDHVHLHIVMSATQLNGLSSRISRQAFTELKQTLQAYQKEKYPELTHSLPHHGKSKDLTLSSKERYKVYPNSRTPQKEKLQKDLEEAYNKSRSVDDFLNHLKVLGHEPYYRGADKRLTGLKYEGDLKYRFSSLGYDKEKFTVLDAIQTKEEQQLAELHDLRASRSTERQQSNEDRWLDRDSDQEDEKEANIENEENERDGYEIEREDPELDPEDDWNDIT